MRKSYNYKPRLQLQTVVMFSRRSNCKRLMAIDVTFLQHQESIRPRILCYRFCHDVDRENLRLNIVELLHLMCLLNHLLMCLLIRLLMHLLIRYSKFEIYFYNKLSNKH